MDLKPRMEALALVLAPRNLALAAPIIRDSQQRGLRTAGIAELRRTITDLLRDPVRREAYGRRALQVVARNTGSLRRTADYLERAWLRP